MEIKHPKNRMQDAIVLLVSAIFNLKKKTFSGFRYILIAFNSILNSRIAA